jgi:beta-glucosidase
MKISIPDHSKLRQPDFTFGVATAAFQIEGANRADGRLPCIWDTFCATPGKVKGNDDGAIACDHYNRWQEDVNLIEHMGVDAYRLSIAWPRVMTQEGDINTAGIAFYKQLLQRLKDKSLKVFVTLYHWDLPQHLEDKGGWLNRETAYKFRDYAELVTKELAPWVDSWATFNEPFCAAILGYGVGLHAPGLKNEKFARQAAHHILLAHGLALPVIRQQAPNAQVGIVLNMNKSYAATAASEDQFAALMRDSLDNQFFIEPLLNGRYPAILERLCPNIMPTVLDGDMAIIQQPIDFIGLNFYTCNHNQYDPQHFYKDVKNSQPVEYTDIGWEIAPHAFTELLVNLNAQYRLPPLYITENGAACDDKLINGQVHDDQRIRYLNGHLNAVHAAMEQGVDIRGYFAWSLMDNFEWAEGYSKRFGLVYVDYATQTRTLKDSAKALQTWLKQRHN